MKKIRLIPVYAIGAGPAPLTVRLAPLTTSKVPSKVPF